MYKVKFFMSGSSPRKLKRGNANLLGGRVQVMSMMPFALTELKNHYSLLTWIVI